MFLGVLPAREAHAHGTSAVGDRERAVRKVVLTVILVGSLLITKDAFPDADTQGRITLAPRELLCNNVVLPIGARIDNGRCVTIFNRSSGRDCLFFRRIFVLGNSIARGFAFEAESMFGDLDQTVERHRQIDLCDKAQLHELGPTGMASCVLYINPVTQIRYTWLQYFDDAGPLTEVKDACTGSGRVPTGVCLQELLLGSQPGDVLLFYMGLHYAAYWAGLAESGKDVDSWFMSSATTWRASVAAHWHGRSEDVFRIRLASHANQDPNSVNRTTRVFNYVPHINLLMDEIFENTNWKVIDQWAINAGETGLYQDSVHFQGPLSQATWHVLLSQLCDESPS
jgi:hypothetical protein